MLSSHVKTVSLDNRDSLNVLDGQTKAQGKPSARCNARSANDFSITRPLPKQGCRMLLQNATL